MKINLKWDKPIRLRDGSKIKQIYRCNLERVRSKPGIYVFARTFGDHVAPLYVGQALRLRKRIEHQFKSNVVLMMGIKQGDAGKRILLVARLILKRGQQKKKVLNIVEAAIIKRAFAEGHELLNKQGAKTKVHFIRSKGNNSSRQIVPLTLYAERRP